MRKNLPVTQREYELCCDVNATMIAVVQRVRQVGTRIDDIANATTEQAQGKTQVEVAITQLDRTTQQNAALVEEGPAAADGLRQQASRLSDAVGAFRDRAPV